MFRTARSALWVNFQEVKSIFRYQDEQVFCCFHCVGLRCSGYCPGGRGYHSIPEASATARWLSVATIERFLSLEVRSDQPHTINVPKEKAESTLSRDNININRDNLDDKLDNKFVPLRDAIRNVLQKDTNRDDVQATEDDDVDAQSLCV